jgi:hypothetical protein
MVGQRIYIIGEGHDINWVKVTKEGCGETEKRKHGAIKN